MSAVRVTPDGAKMVIGLTKTEKVFDLATAREERACAMPPPEADLLSRITAVAVSEKQLAVVVQEQKGQRDLLRIKILDRQTGTAPDHPAPRRSYGTSIARGAHPMGNSWPSAATGLLGKKASRPSACGECGID